MSRQFALPFAFYEKKKRPDIEEQASNAEIPRNVSSSGELSMGSKWKQIVGVAGLLFLLVAAIIGGVCGAGKCTSSRGFLDSDAGVVTPSPTRSPVPCPVNATGPLRVGGRPVKVTGTDAVRTMVSMYCDDNEEPREVEGIWYTVVGGGEVLRASTCTDEVLESSTAGGSNTTLSAVSSLEESFDTRITVFDGTVCGQMRCVAFNDQFCGDKSSVSWLAEKGRVYFMFVEGNSYQFDVDFEDNGECERSIGPIDNSGLVVAGSMRARVPLNYTYFTCNITPTRGGQVWYWVRCQICLAPLCAYFFLPQKYLIKHDPVQRDRLVDGCIDLSSQH